MLQPYQSMHKNNIFVTANIYLNIVFHALNATRASFGV